MPRETVVTSMDLKADLEQAVAAALAQQQQNPPAPAMWGSTPNYCTVHRQQISWDGIWIQRSSLDLKKMFSTCNNCGEVGHRWREWKKSHPAVDGTT